MTGGRPRRADREDSVRRTVYVSDIDQHVRIFIVFRLVNLLSLFYFDILASLRFAGN